MAYIGKEPANSFISFEKQVFTIVNSQTAYTLSHAITNENDIRLVVNNVIQEPGSGKAYTASGTTLTLSAALVNGTDEMYCVYLGRALQTVNAPDGSISNSQVAPTIITGQTALGATPADTDELLISDAGTLKRVDYSFLKSTNTPYFYATLSSNQTLSDATNTKIAFNTASIDSDSAFDTSNNRFVVPSGKAGKYFIYAQLNSDSGDVEFIETTIAKNGTEVNYIINNPSGSHSNLQTNIAAILDLAVSDYVELFTSSNQTSGNATITASVRGKNTYLLGYKLSE